ncbi:flagellar hook-length control protein FliK [Pseudoalteromonas sp. CR1]|uniref:flagellar hook-length control protein FliK n=1 Tax=Pseudoalteromonas sp. CR1 TaxID=2861964 RepID=UPI001C5F0E7B|nr:flagellar hook-length control protein FliK [Pseudoalteromonas sp. CR1]MBW4966402.1 flagellar hook-length control protein FliK [Pseudoalteromonas sp. CR1]
MNTPTQITLSNSLVINSSTNNQTNELPQLPGEVLAAKNIQFSKDSITLDVLVNKHWQTLRLGTTHAPQSLDKIASANIQLSADGKQLAILPNVTTLTINKPAQLQRLLNFISTGAEVESKPLAVQVALTPAPKLIIDKFNASIAINKDVAQLLSTEQPLKLVMSTSSKGAQINVINRFADTVHTQPLSQTKLVKMLTSLLPNAQLHATPKLAILTHPQKSGSFTTTVSNAQLAELPRSPVKVSLTNQADKLVIKTQAENVKVMLSNSFSKPFNELLTAQHANLSTSPTHNNSSIKVSPLVSTHSPIKSWLQTSFSDLKTRINDAVSYFENKSFANENKAQFSPLPTLNKQLTAAPPLTNKINVIEHAGIQVATNAQKPSDDRANILPKHFSQMPPIVQLTQLIKANVAVWQSPNAKVVSSHLQIPNAKTTNTSENKQPQIEKATQQSKTAVGTQSVAPLSTQIKAEHAAKNTEQVLKSPTAQVQTTLNNELQKQTRVKELNSLPLTKVGLSHIEQANTDNKLATLPITKPNSQTAQQTHVVSLTPTNDNLLSTVFNNTATIASQSQMLQPIEAKILTPLLKLPPSHDSTQKISEENPPLSSQIADIQVKATKQTPDLNALVNQAFNRMVSSSNVSPTAVQREILATLQPHTLTHDTLQSSFTKGLEQLAVSILAAPIINQSVTPITFESKTGIDALLQVLMPTFKTGKTSSKILEQLQQSQVQALAGELVQVKNTLTQVNASTPNQQPESNPLAQFLLPMKLPPEAAQTEIALGQYKKPSADKLEPKNVWFVRLNFDYAELGQLQITAELMDKSLDCQLLASSQEVSAIAHPHLDNLRSKLAKHGLQVAELNLKRGEATHAAFYKSHAIINIKV